MQMQSVSITLEDLFDSSKEPKKRAPSRSKVKKVERTLTTAEVHLIDYWIEIGMLRRDGRFPGDTSKNVYLFQHELVGDLELSMPWEKFFDVFNGMNHAAFLKEMEGEIVENPFNPWRNPRMVGISIRIKPFEGDDIRPYNRQDYRLVEVFSPEDKDNTGDTKAENSPERTTQENHGNTHDAPDSRPNNRQGNPRTMKVFICDDSDSGGSGNA